LPRRALLSILGSLTAKGVNVGRKFLTVLAVLAAAVLVMVVPACGGDDDDDGGGGEAEASGTLVFAGAADPVVLDGARL
jgi:peptide/nickel transport system substrate-binding protein